MEIILLVVVYIAFFIFLIILTIHENTGSTKTDANAIKAAISLLEKLEEFKKSLAVSRQ